MWATAAQPSSRTPLWTSQKVMHVQKREQKLENVEHHCDDMLLLSCH